MRGQIFRSDMVPSSPSRHIRHLRLRYPAREDTEPVPCLPVGTDPDVERPARGPGDAPQLVDLPAEEGCDLRGTCNRPACRDHAEDVDSACPGPCDQAGRKVGVSRPDDDGVSMVPEYFLCLVLCYPAAVAPCPQGRYPVITRRHHPGQAPCSRGSPGMHGQDRDPGTYTPKSATGRLSRQKNGGTSLPSGDLPVGECCLLWQSMHPGHGIAGDVRFIAPRVQDMNGSSDSCYQWGK